MKKMISYIKNTNYIKIITYFVAVATLLFSVWMTWVFVKSVGKADDSIKAGLIGIFGMLSVTLVVHYQTKKREINARHFADKRDGYMHLIDLIFELLFSIKAGKSLSEKTMQVKMIKFKKSLLVWGGPEIIEAWNQYELKADENLPSVEYILEMENVLRAVRKDLGHNDSTLKFGSLSALFLLAKEKKKVIGKGLD